MLSINLFISQFIDLLLSNKQRGGANSIGASSISTRCNALSRMPPTELTDETEK